MIEELRVYNGNAIADVVALFNEAHCFEIKGATDKVERITVQSTFYNAAFRRITLVITESSLSKALKIAPPFWGIMVAHMLDADQVSFQRIRSAKQNPEFTKELAALTLWKSEMLELLQGQQHHRQPRDILAQLISASTRKAELSSHICEMLLNRHLTTSRSKDLVEYNVRDMCIN